MARQARRSETCSTTEPHLQLGAVWPGSNSSPVDFHQFHVIQRQIGHRLLQSIVSLLQFLHPLCLIHPETPILLPPFVVGSVADPELTQNLRHRHPFAMQHLGLPQFPRNLFRRMPLLSHVCLLLAQENTYVCRISDRVSGGRTIENTCRRGSVGVYFDQVAQLSGAENPGARTNPLALASQSLKPEIQMTHWHQPWGLV